MSEHNLRTAVFASMPTANIHDRHSIERIYPRAAFAVDAAAHKKKPANELVRGISILSATDDAASFEIEIACHHVGEVAGMAFLAPSRPLAASATGRDPAAGQGRSTVDPADGY